MSSQPNSSSGNGRLYRDQTRLPVPRLQVNGKTHPPSSTSGAVSGVSKSTAAIAKNSALTFIPPSRKVGPVDSELVTSFDPMKDRHLWTMWRIAVNGRIMDEMRRRNQSPPPRQEGGKRSELYPYGQALVRTPMSRFIRVENGSNALARVMMNPGGEGGSELTIPQFVFYGVPRVVLKKTKRTTHLTGEPE
ncbi:hypothetical protein ACOMHN_052782 [Nucella lapillus]